LLDSPAAAAVQAEKLELKEVPHCDLALHTEAGYAFFRIIHPRDDVLDRWRETQDEIANFLYALSVSQGQLPNAYLTLLMQEPGDPIILQQIERNAYVCRKLILPYSDDAETIAQRLPFFGLSDKLGYAIRRPLADPRQAAAGTGLRPEFVNTLLSQTKPAALAADLATYRAVDDAPGPNAELATTTTVAAPLHRLRVAEVTLHGFRNFTKSPPFTFHFGGDLIVIFGRNGTGKTSLIEALEWGLTGVSSRVELDKQRVPITAHALISRRDDVPEARVTVNLEGPDQEQITIERSIDKKSRRQPVRVDGKSCPTRKLLTRLIHQPGSDSALPGAIAELRRTFQTLHFLSQHTLEALLSTDSNHAAAITHMAGTERFLPLVKKSKLVRDQLARDLKLQQGLLNANGDQLKAVRAQRKQHHASWSTS
jgi:hypothetical protein